MSGERKYLLGVRGKLILNILLLVVLSLWLLGLVQMRLTRTALTRQLTARGKIVVASVQKVLGIVLDDRPAQFPPGPDRLNQLRNLLWSFEEDPEVDAVNILDRSGAPLFSGDRKPGRPPSPVTADPGGPKGLQEFTSPLFLGGTEVGAVAIRFSQGGIQRQLAFSHLGIIVQLGISALVLIVFINLLVSLNVLAPIRKLLASTERIGAGNLNHAADTNRRDEFGDLAVSFNSMLARLREGQEVNRRQLESLRKTHEDLLAKEEELIRTEKMAAVGRVAAGVAHEVGNPLGGVTGYLAMLRDDTLSNEERREYLSCTEREITRINRIMLDLLNYARPPNLEWSNIDLNALARDVRQLLSSQPELQKATLNLDLAPDLPPIRGDLHHTRQMLVNIVLNAAQAIPDGGTITLQTSRPDEPHLAALIRVRDNGPGIPPQDLPHLFEPFFTSGKGGRGTGLGLALCQQTASSIEARIEAASEPGQGTTFTIRFQEPGSATQGLKKDA
jgi:signal transduction histidine kinase